MSCDLDYHLVDKILMTQIGPLCSLHQSTVPSQAISQAGSGPLAIGRKLRAGPRARERLLIW